MLNPADQFHVGVVAYDLAATLEELTLLFGYEWCDPIGATTEVDLPTGIATVDFRCAYSRSTPRLEVVQQIPGTLWTPTWGSGIHHLGYWSDDVATDGAELERHGYTTEATRCGPDGSLFFAFLRSDFGPRVELVTRAAQPSIEGSWAQTPCLQTDTTSKD